MPNGSALEHSLAMEHSVSFEDIEPCIRCDYVISYRELLCLLERKGALQYRGKTFLKPPDQRYSLCQAWIC